MSFITDKQTLDDLNILGKYKNKSIFNLFNLTKTAGAERLLGEMFQHPLIDIEQINKRSEQIRYFQEKGSVFPFDLEMLQTTEDYLNVGTVSNLLGTFIQTVHKKALLLLGIKEEHDLVVKRLHATIITLLEIRKFVSNLLKDNEKNPFAGELEKVGKLFEGGKLKWLMEVKNPGQLSFLQIVKYDYLFRSSLRVELDIIRKLVYLMDVYIAVASVSKAKSFTYAKAIPAELDLLNIEEGFHPCLNQATPNSLNMDESQNVVFLTGANMAGKSTFMKSFGICLYLAHMGFPVPAKSMTFSVKEGLYTSINVSDDINMGYSHFYAEVLRVKKIAEEISAPKNLYIIFDELFKGTNVKDAYDATLAVTEMFTEYRNCFFIISTHIVEVGEVLAKQCNNIIFTYMPTQTQGKIPVYTYRSKEGISSDRHGMMIIENEGILEMI